MLEYDSIRALIEPTILKYFQKSLWSSILAKLQNENFELVTFVQIVKKIVIAKVKANLQPWVTTRHMDQQYAWSSQLANTIAAKANSQGNS